MRVDDAIDLTDATPAQRVGLSSGLDSWQTKAVPELGIESVRLADGPHGVRIEDPEAESFDLFSSLPATCFPPAVGLAATWNPDLLERVGTALAAEAAAGGVDVLLGPGINIKRSPLGGRNFEYFSEDPHLTGRLAAALVRGLQEAGVGACVKHFAVNNQESDRMRVDAVVDERALREIYLSAFEHIVTTEQPWMVMGAYNFINGVPGSEHRQLLTGILREEWGFQGAVVSDWGAVYDRVASVAAGLDLEMPTHLPDSDERLFAALEAGEIAAADVDLAATRIATLSRRAEAARPKRPGEVDAESAHMTALAAAREAIVLLKNDGILPLPLTGRVAVIGEFARTPRYQGAGSSYVTPTRLDNALDALRLRHADVDFAPGFDPRVEAVDRSLVDEAARVARGADVAVVFLGLPADAEAEGFDREHLNLPAGQLEVLRAVSAANPRVVVVLSRGGVVTTTGWDELASAILDGSLLGQAGGTAIAEVLVGEVNPSGRLAETIPARLEDTPSFLGFPGEASRVVYGEGVFVGYRGYDSTARAVGYPFGHGLSYTTYAVSIGEPAVTGSRESLRVSVPVTVANTGSVVGAEVVQLYVGPPLDSPVRRPTRELRGFGKVTLEPGESRTIVIELDARSFARWDPARHDWVVDGGRYAIEAGASSRDIRATAAADIPASGGPAPLGEYATLAEWLAFPGGRAQLSTWQQLALFTAPPEPGQETTRRMFEAIPVRKLVRLFGIPLTEDDLDAARRELNMRAAS